MPVVWLGKRKGFKELSRTYGPDLVLEFCKYSQGNGIKHYFYGATEEINERLIKNLRSQFPELKIVGSYAPPLRSIKDREGVDVINQMNQANPDIIWEY